MARLTELPVPDADDFLRLANDIHDLLNLAMVPLRHRVRLPVDLRDLLLFHTLAEVLREETDDLSVPIKDPKKLRERAADVYKLSRRLPSGGAYALYPKVLYAKRRDSVCLTVTRDSGTTRLVEELDKFYIKQFSIPFEARNLRAELRPLHVTTEVHRKSPGTQLYPRPLIWKWHLTPQAEGNLGLDFWLERVQENARLMETVWEFLDNYRAVQVVVEVKPELPSAKKLLQKVLANPSFWSSLAVAFLAAWLLYYYGPPT